MKTVGFIGLGMMGLPMAQNLLKKGYPLVVYNRTPEKADELVTAGAELVASPAEVARAADVVFTNVSNDEALLDVFYGQNGIMEGVRAGFAAIDCSTVSPETSRRIHADMAAHFADFLDAPVTGSRPAAESGTLVFMIGGSEDAFQEQADLFGTLGSRAVYMGPSGSGSSAKLAANLIVGINAAALAEGMAFAVQAGVHPEKFLEVVTNGAANSRQAELKGMKIVERDFSVQFALKHMLKDLLLASEQSRRLQVPAPMLGNATSLFQMSFAKGLGETDACSVVQCYEEWMGRKVERPTPAPAAAARAQVSDAERRRSTRISLDIPLQISVYQWEQEGSFSGQTIEGRLYDLSESGMQIVSPFPLAQDMFIVIHFPFDSDLPPITAKIIRIVAKEREFRYGCMLSGLPPYIRLKLEEYIQNYEEGNR